MITKFLRTLLCLLMIGSTTCWTIDEADGAAPLPPANMAVTNAYKHGDHYYTKKSGHFYELTNVDGTLTVARDETKFGTNNPPTRSSVYVAKTALGITTLDASDAGAASSARSSGSGDGSATSSKAPTPARTLVEAPGHGRPPSPITVPQAAPFDLRAARDRTETAVAAGGGADMGGVIDDAVDAGAVAAPVSAPRAPGQSAADQLAAAGCRVFTGATYEARLAEAEQLRRAQTRNARPKNPKLKKLDFTGVFEEVDEDSFLSEDDANALANARQISIAEAAASKAARIRAKAAKTSAIAEAAAAAERAAAERAAAAKQARRNSIIRGAKWTVSTLAGIVGVLLTAMSLRVRSKYWHLVQPGTVRSIAADAALERLSPFDRLSVKVVRSLIEKGKGALVGLQNAGNWVGDKASRLTQDAKSKWAAFRANNDAVDTAEEDTDDEDKDLNALLGQYDLV